MTQKPEWHRRVQNCPHSFDFENIPREPSVPPHQFASAERTAPEKKKTERKQERDMMAEINELSGRSKSLADRVERLENRDLEEPVTRVHVVGTAVYGERVLENPEQSQTPPRRIVVTRAGQVYLGE